MSLSKRLRYLERAWQQKVEREREETSRETELLFSPQQGWEPAGRYTLLRRLRLPSSLVRDDICEFLLPSDYGPEDLLFFDTETTGLSGGAGNSIFLVGTAWLEGQALCVEQVFLKDFPGEQEFLSHIAERFNRHRVFVSYNGRAFDAHVLRTRFLLNRMSLELEQQTDLLYWARRLWRRALPDCSLGTVEREILGISREMDVPGFEVPGIYLDYLRSGRPGRLNAVFEHNLQDVRSLVELLSLVNSILSSGKRAPGAEAPEAAHDSALIRRTDRTALGSFFLSRDEQWGVELLKESFSAGDEGAGRALSLYYKRSGAWLEAVALWQRMASERMSLFAAVELAKYFEHREKKIELALEWVQTVLSWHPRLERRARAELNHRRRRLLQKLERRGSRI